MRFPFGRATRPPPRHVAPRSAGSGGARTGGAEALSIDAVAPSRLRNDVRDAVIIWATPPRTAALRIWFVPDTRHEIGGCEVWGGFAGEATRELRAYVPIAPGTTICDLERELHDLGLQFPASEYGVNAGDWRVAIDAQGLKSYFLGVRKV